MFYFTAIINDAIMYVCTLNKIGIFFCGKQYQCVYNYSETKTFNIWTKSKLGCKLWQWIDSMLLSNGLFIYLIQNEKNLKIYLYKYWQCYYKYAKWSTWIY